MPYFRLSEILVRNPEISDITGILMTLEEVIKVY